MDIIDKNEFDNIEKLPEIVEDKTSIINVGEEGFKELLVKMQNPVDAQKELAVQIKQFLDQKIANDMKKVGYLTDSTRRWVREYNNILEKLQKALYGDKSVNLHLHKVSHSQIAAQIRKSSNETKTDN